MEINKNLNDIEKAFNFAGGLPIVAIFSGALRAQAAQVQFIAGIALGIIGLIGQMFSNNVKWERLADTGLEQVIHGALNYIRGVGEMLIGLTIVGSLGLLAIQYKDHFEPIYKYEAKTHPDPDPAQAAG